MKNSPIRKIENFVTKTGVCLLLFMTIVGILFVFDIVCNLDIFPSNTGKQAFLIFCLIICVLIFSCVMVATMLNISRIANAVEEISDKYQDRSDKNAE